MNDLAARARLLADNPWAEYLPDVHKMMHDMADALDQLRDRLKAAEAVCEAAENHGSDHSVLNLALEAWRKRAGQLGGER